MEDTVTDQRGSVTVNLPESLLLLAIDDDTGEISSQMRSADFGTAGAVLLELFIAGKLQIVDGHVRIIDSTMTGDPLLDDAVALIRASDKPRDAKHWVKKLADAKIMNQVLDQLIARDIVRSEEHRLLWIIPVNRFPAENREPEDDLRAKLRSIVIDNQPPDVHSAALIGLLKATDLTGAVFSKSERKDYRERIDGIANGDLLSGAVAKLIKDAQNAMTAAIVAAVIVPTVTASST